MFQILDDAVLNIIMLIKTVPIITIHLVVFCTYSLSQFLNRMNKDVTSNPVLHSTLEVVQELDGCSLQAGK